MTVDSACIHLRGSSPAEELCPCQLCAAPSLSTAAAGLQGAPRRCKPLEGLFMFIYLTTSRRACCHA